MLRVLFTIIALIIAMFVGMWLLWHLLGLVTFVGYIVVGLVFFVGLCSIVYMLLKPKGMDISRQIADKSPKKYKVFDTTRKVVYGFREEPSLQDIAQLNDELHIAQLELQGDIIELQNDTKIKIVQDDGKEAVKVKIPDKKGKDNTMWVPRSSVVKDDTRKLK